MTTTKTQIGAKGKTMALGLIVAAFVVACSVLTARPAHAATFTVNSTGDENDLDFPGGVFDGSSDSVCDADAATGDQCTLRAAIQHANATSGSDEIHFSIPGTEVHSISPSSILPPITEAVTIDGYTQDSDTPDPSDDAKPNTLDQGNDAVLKIELNGENAGGVPGLRIWDPFTTVKGLIINGFGSTGVVISEGLNTVEGNYIGTDAAGTAGLGNGSGVSIEGNSNTVGGTSPGARNIISGNDGVGIFIAFGGVTGNRVMGNYIGTDKDGDDALGNSFDGVNLAASVSNNTVGGTEEGARNIISGNGRFGVILESGVTSNRVEGNYIGTDAVGTIDLGNLDDGVLTRGGASGNSIGGTTAGAGNIISGNGGNGIEVSYYRDSNNPGDSDPTPPVGNSILSNSIYDNDALGINLVIPPNEPPGATNNDARDLDTGANRRQNFPVITSATTTNVQGIFNSTPNQTFTIQLFSSPQADPSGFGEGKELIAEQTVTTSEDRVIRKKKKKKKKRRTIFIPGGNAAFEFVLPAGTVTTGDVVTTTANNTATGDTSEFSKALTVS